MIDKTDNKRQFGNPGTKAESEFTVRITKMLAEVEQAMLSRNESKAKTLAAKVRKMIESSANTSTGKMQMDELKSIMLGVSFSRSGAKTKFGIAEQVMRDGSVHLDFAAARSYLEGQTADALRYIVRDARAARDAGGREGRKFNYYSDLVLEAQKELKKRGFSRPGAKANFSDAMRGLTGSWMPRPQGTHRYKKGDRVVSHEGLNPRTGVIDRPVRDQYGNPLYVVYWDNDGGTRWVAEQYLTKMSRPGAKARFAVEDRFYFGQPMGEHGRAGALAAKGMRDGAQAYKDGKTDYLNPRDPQYKGMSEKDFEIYGNWWRRGWTGEQLKALRARDVSKGIDLPGRRLSIPGQPERFGLEDACWEGYEPVGTKQKDGRPVPNCVPKDKNEQPEEFAAEVVASRGSKRAEIKRDATGRWAAVLIQSNRTGIPGGPADEQVLDMKWFANEANARRAANKMLASRPGAKARFAVEDRFYFGQPERFAINPADLNYAKSRIRAASPEQLREIEQELLPLAKSGDKNAETLLAYLKTEWDERYRARFSRPGQPEWFANVDKMGKIEINRLAMTADLIREAQRLRDEIKKSNKDFDKEMLSLVAQELKRRGVLLPHGADKALNARPGQPERFEASSLERGDFAEASKSPMLGKLLAAKAMPDGGWRAVQAGSDTLVISFEDADLARDFGRRVASKGYSATSPVATTGRYWNVEVKNG